MVCIGGDWLAPDKAPKRSVKPPRADKLDRALIAPGLANSWANGMADDKGDAATVGGVGKVELDPSSGLEDELAPSRLAFCSSTLKKKLGLVIKKDIKQIQGI